MVAVDEKFGLGPTDTGRYRRRVELVVDASVALALLLQDVRMAGFRERLNTSGRLLAETEEDEGAVVAPAWNGFFRDVISVGNLRRYVLLSFRYNVLRPVIMVPELTKTTL